MQQERSNAACMSAACTAYGSTQGEEAVYWQQDRKKKKKAFRIKIKCAEFNCDANINAVACDGLLAENAINNTIQYNTATFKARVCYEYTAGPGC